MAVFATLRAARTLKAAGLGDPNAHAVAERVQAVANGNSASTVDLQGFDTTADLEQFARTSACYRRGSAGTFCAALDESQEDCGQDRHGYRGTIGHEGN